MRLGWYLEGLEFGLMREMFRWIPRIRKNYSVYLVGRMWLCRRFLSGESMWEMLMCWRVCMKPVNWLGFLMGSLDGNLGSCVGVVGMWGSSLVGIVVGVGRCLMRTMVCLNGAWNVTRMAWFVALIAAPRDCAFFLCVLMFSWCVMMSIYGC